MTIKLYDDDSHIREFIATVLECKHQGDVYLIVLDRTAFFPEGGGQESDKGTIDDAVVTDVQIVEDTIYHYTDKPLTVNSKVLCKLDWDVRFHNMQNHSGEHIVSGIIHSMFGYDNVGFHLGKDEMTVDINGPLDRKSLLKVEMLANEAIIKNAAFSAVYPTKQQLEQMTYRSKKVIKGSIRIVTVEGYDVCACCAPHVTSACEIGIIKILDFYKNKGGTRLYIKCGYDALSDYNEKYNSVCYVSNLLSVKQSECEKSVDRLLEQLENEKHKLYELKKSIIEQRINNYNCSESTSVIFEEKLDIRQLQIYADSIYKKFAGIRAVFSAESNEKYNFAICGEDKLLQPFFNDFKQIVNIKGGGRNGMVQGIAFCSAKGIQDFFDGYNS